MLDLVKKNFYNGLRFHRVEPGFVIQVGDPNTRDYTKKDLWGTGGSGTPVGVAELSRKHLHVKGAVAMAHPGNAAKADAQFYVMLGARPRLDGKYVVFGRVISGLDVPRQDPRRRRHSKNVREAVNGPTSTIGSSSGIALDDLRRIHARHRSGRPAT